MTDLIILLGEKLGLPLWATVTLVVIVVVGALFGAYILGRIRDKIRHWSRDFPDAVIIARSTVVGGQLALRTLDVKRLEEIVLDPELARIIEAAARRTTENNPGIVIEDPAKHRQMMTDFINTVSKYIPSGRGPQLLAVTKERYPSMWDARQANVIRLLLSTPTWTAQFLDATPEKPVALHIGDTVHKPRRDKTLPWVARMFFKHRGCDAEGRTLIAVLGSPWDDDEAK